jgi:uncharacterized protein (DUF58 family)
MAQETTQPARTPRKLTELLDPQFMARLDSIDVLSRKILQGKMQGERRSKRRGQSVEFADHRPYVAGDDLRFVDWNVYGRLEQLFLKLFMEEQDLTIHIAIDTSASIAFGTPSKELFIKRLSAALAYIGLVNNNRVTLSSFSSGIVNQMSGMRGRTYIPRMAEFLLSSECNGVSDFDTSCRHLASGRIGSGIMIVLSDFLFKEGVDSGLRRLLSRNYDLYLIQVLSPQELEPDLSGDLKLIDIEDDDTAEVTISNALIDFYKRNLAAWCNEIKDFCNRRNAVHVLGRSDDSVESRTLNYLRRIRLLR